MPTYGDETLHDRYAREHADHMARLAKMTPEQIAEMELSLHNAMAEVDRLRGKASQGGEAVEVVAWSACAGSKRTFDFKCDAVAAINYFKSAFPNGKTDMIELMTVAQHQRILAASVGSAEPVAWAICKEPGRVDWLSATYANKRAAEEHVASYKDGMTLYITPLYTHPAGQVADDLTMVKVSRELLEQIAVELEHDNDRYFLGRELRALLNGGRS